MSNRMNNQVADWLAINFLPHEAELRRMLRGVCINSAEIDDAIQETCYRILVMPDLDHIHAPKPFVFRTAKNIVLDRIRRDTVVSIETMANLEELDIADTAPSPDRVYFAREELTWVFGLISNLPDRCKSVFRARRIHGMSQNETAESLGLTDSVVEHEMMRGMRLMSEMVSRRGMDPDNTRPKDITPQRAAKTIDVKE
jgi:RNA polymerase sigma factor (sigma-70 family)